MRRRAIEMVELAQMSGTLLVKAAGKYSSKASRLADWIEKNNPEGLTLFAFASTHQRRIRTTNSLERLHREIRHR